MAAHRAANLMRLAYLALNARLVRWGRQAGSRQAYSDEHHHEERGHDQQQPKCYGCDHGALSKVDIKMPAHPMEGRRSPPLVAMNGDWCDGSKRHRDILLIRPDKLEEIMDENEPATMQELGDAMADFSACILAIASALENKGLLSNSDLRDAAQERLLTLQAHFLTRHPYPLLHMMATHLPTRQEE